MLNILLLLAGQSSFFSKEEFIFPRPLIEIHGKSMIQHVIENLSSIRMPKRFTFVVNDEDCRRYHLDNVLLLLTDKETEIIRVKGDTGGALCSALLAIDRIDNADALVIANADQIIDTDLNEILGHFQDSGADGGVACFETIHPRWSYVRFDQHRSIVEAAEKRPISKHAIAGFYYFKNGHTFVQAGMSTIKKGAHVNGSYYVSMVLNELILKQMHIAAFHLSPDSYHTLYSPQKIEEYQTKMKNKPIASQKINVVIPMAGDGSRFAVAGYSDPKPFIDVEGKPMIARVLDNLYLVQAHYILIAKKEHLATNKHQVDFLKNNYPVTFIEIDKPTEGAACTLLHARSHIDNTQGLLIANCDQIIDASLSDFIDDCFLRNLDGSILTFHDPERNPKYAKRIRYLLLRL
jgi:NDP-sugar pyrophosphorylase family protein